MGTASFSVAASSGTTMTYQWMKSGVNIPGANASAYSISNVQTNNQGAYSVKVFNSGGNVTSANAVLTVLTPPSITSQPQSEAVLAGQNASFSVGASGAALLAYQWTLGGVALPGATSATLTVNNVQAGDLGNYAVIITNAYGSITSSIAALSFGSAPVITAQPQSVASSKHDSALFSVSANGTAALAYRWYFNGTPIAGSAGAGSTYSIPSVNTPNVGNYWVVVTNSFGSVTSATVVLTMDAAPYITAQPVSQTVVAGQNAVFSVSAIGLATVTYQWYTNGAAMTGATNATLTLLNVPSNAPGSLKVVISNPNGSVTSSVVTLTVTLPAALTSQPHNQTILQGQNTTFAVTATGTGPLTCQWNFNGSPIPGATNSSLTLTSAQTNQAGNYFVLVANTFSSVTSAVAALTVSVPPAIATQPQNQHVIAGQTAMFSVSATGTGPLFYQWNFNNAPITSATNSNLILTNAQTSQAGNYFLLVTNAWGAATGTVVQLSVQAPPALTTQPQNQTATAGQNATFSAVATGTGPLFYQWNFNGTDLPGATNCALTLSNVPPAYRGTYSLVVTNSAGSVTSSVVSLEVTIPPIKFLTLGGPGAGMTGGGFAIQLNVPTGCTCVILASTNFIDWLPIATNVSTNGGITFTDSAAARYGNRFYRAVAY